MEIGEVWAFRKNSSVKTFHPVSVKALGSKRPPRVKIQFVEDEFEGRQEWVSPARLEVLWGDLGPYAERDAQWKALEKAPTASKLEDDAYWCVLRDLPDPVAQFWPGQSIRGMLAIADVPALANLTGLDELALTANEATIVEDGFTYVPAAVTMQVARAWAAENSFVILRRIEKEERELERDSVLGHEMGRGWPKDMQGHIPGEAIARSAEKHEKPVWTLVREWIGEPAAARDELVEMRRELSRVGDIAQRAVGYLKSLRSATMARKLESELLHPRSEWGGYGVYPEPEYKTPYTWILKSELAELRARPASHPSSGTEDQPSPHAEIASEHDE